MYYYRLSLLLPVMLFALHSSAQRSFSFAAGAGILYYNGDLSENFTSSFFRPGGQLSASTYILPSLSLRMGFLYGNIGGSDARATDAIRKARNLQFESPLGELSISGVYELIPDRNFGIAWRSRMHFSPYLWGGIAVLGFDPRTEYEGQMVRLQPLGTEGQFIGDNGRKPYRLVQPSLPFGVGINLRISDFTGINLETGYRITFTDYLDDVSTTYPPSEALIAASGSVAAALSNRTGTVVQSGSIRGNPGVKDSYVFSTLSFVYYLDRRK